MSANEIPPPTPLAKRFVRYVLGFFVGVVIGIAPFLGSVNVPGFRALLSVMPFQITSDLIPLSSFLMGIIVVAVQFFFYAAEGTSPVARKKRFQLALFVMIVGFVLFVILRDEFTVSVPRGGSRVTVLISSSPMENCDCKNPQGSPANCIRRLAFAEEAIERCWGHEPLTRRSQLLKLSYLILTGGVGVLIGLLLLEDEARRQTKRSAAEGVDQSGTAPGNSDFDDD